MGDRIDALETQMGSVNATLQELALQLQQQSAVLTALSRQMGKKVVPHAENSNDDASS